MPEKGKTATAYQFMRQGYFCLDNQDAAPGHLVFNRSVSLKDSFKKNKIRCMDIGNFGKSREEKTPSLPCETVHFLVQ